MYFGFFEELRRHKVPVGVHEALALAAALRAGLHDSSLEGFYEVARALCVHTDAHLDAFDRAFARHFKGVESQGMAISEELLSWLAEARAGRRRLSPEELALLERFSREELERLFRERIAEQRERHDGGNRWIGTGGTSPFGHSGVGREGIRVGGPGWSRSAVAVAEARRFRDYRDDVVLDVRQMQVALRKLRAFAREGTAEELDVEGTIDKTARNAGELEVVTRPPRRSNTRVVLLMDVGGSMEPYSGLVSRLFTAASKATHFKDLRTLYFHNCVYGVVYPSARLREPLAVDDLIAQTGKNYKLIVVGDALMAPYELLDHLGPDGWFRADAPEAIFWLLHLSQAYPRSVWLNPEPPSAWWQTTVRLIANVFPMFPLTLEGLGDAVGQLTRARQA